MATTNERAETASDGWMSSPLQARAAFLAMRLRAEFDRQADRAFLWLVVVFAAGIVAFFSWPVDPPMWSGPLLVTMGASLFAIRRSFARIAGSIVLAFGLGHAAAQIRTWMVATPILERTFESIPIEGRVIDAEKRPEGNHVVLADFHLPNVPANKTPKAIRLTTPAAHGIPSVGSRIHVRATVGPPGTPVVPDGFQFGQFLYFESIGGSGFSVGRWQTIENAPPLGWQDRSHAWTEGLRRAIGDRFAAVVPGGHDTVAAALINGEQSAIPQTLQEAYRVSGIAHILSVSGVHLSLAAGIMFVFVRRLLALIPWIALRFDTKKIAAWAGLCGTGFYLVISGMSIPAIRSFLMVAAVLVGVLVDRKALSLRNIAWAALILMAIYPDAILGPSFEMSFLAVLCLIALYEQAWLRVRWRGSDGRLRIVRAAALSLFSLMITDVAAGGGTALFAAYHFNRLPTYSMFTNLLASPLTGLWIMPAAIMSILLMPFGWDKWATQVMGWGVALLDDLAEWVAHWPGAQVHIQPMTTAAMIGGTLGAIFCCLWRGRLRWLGLAPIAFAFVQPMLTPIPDLLVDDTARVVAVSSAQGHMVIRPSRAGRFVRDVWTSRYGAESTVWPRGGTADPGLGLTCDNTGCILARNGRRALIATKASAIVEDCGQVDVIVTALHAADLCASGRIVDIAALKRDGAAAIWLKRRDVRVRTARDGMGDRIWNRSAAETGDNQP